MSESIEAKYCTEFPTKQTIIDIFSGLWKSSFPEDSGIKAGTAPNFEDARVVWAQDIIGGFTGKSVLELGPYEAYNTWQLSEYGASPLIAIEGNNINYLKCLLVKEVLDVKVNLLHGDILEYLEHTDATVDICWASGVLYHQTNPLRLLDGIGKVCRTVFFWTHFYDDVIEQNLDSYPHFKSQHVESITHNGFTAQHYARSYRMNAIPTYFSGGSEPYANWIRKEDIFEYLNKLGFKNIKVRGINMEHKAGPSISFMASKDDIF